MLKPTLLKWCRREGLVFLCGALILTGSIVASNGRIFATAQGPRKIVSKGFVLRNTENDPVQITNIRVHSAPRRFEEEFDDSDDWLKALSLEIDNNWNKPIVYMRVVLSFPETQSSGNRMSFHMYLGNEPGSPAPLKRENLYVAPGKKLVINVANHYEEISRFLQTRFSMSQINKVEIQVALAVSDDKTAWGDGVFFVQDPYKAGRYIPISAKAATP